MRLIDADALILALETQDYSGSPESLEDWTPQDLTKAEIADINNAPTIDAEPIRCGKWKHIEEYKGAGFGFYKCSVCGEPLWFTTKYCPNCGAKMEQEELDEADISGND